jgi:threonine/homoserine/homoserine lactone efflux protein
LRKKRRRLRKTAVPAARPNVESRAFPAVDRPRERGSSQGRARVFGVSDYPAFAVAVLVFLAIPGPGTFALLTATARGGLRAGYAALAGIMLGDWLLMLAAMVGVAALLVANPLLFKAVQYLGVAYLVYVGVQLLRANGRAATLLPMRAGTWLRQAFLITVINPKAIVFYMAFFPLFIDPARHQGATTLLAMGLTISALTLIYGSLLIVAGQWTSRRLRAQPDLGRWLSRLAGVALIGFGARLATES